MRSQLNIQAFPDALLLIRFYTENVVLQKRRGSAAPEKEINRRDTGRKVATRIQLNISIGSEIKYGAL
jgi:hypothetical protein